MAAHHGQVSVSMAQSLQHHAAHLLAGLLLLFLALPASAADPASQAAARDLASAKAKELFMLHRKAIKALQTTLRSPAFASYFAAPDDASRAAALADIEASTLKFQRYFEIEEMCLIDRSGHELVRLVHGKPEYELSRDEASNSFFAPAFALAPGETLVSEVYRSPDTGRWVVAYVSPIASGGSNVALLHFETEIFAIASDLAEGLDGSRQALLVFDEKGRRLFDSRVPDVDEASELQSGLGSETFDRLLARIDDGEPVVGHAVAHKTVRGWTLIAAQR